MTHEPTEQLAPAIALVQLLTENPDLPEACWTINDGTLRAHLFGPAVGYLTGLEAYADALGGGITPASEFEHLGTVLRQHDLVTIWRDVRVVVSVNVPVGRVADLRDGALAEQRHKVLDPAVPVDTWAGAAA